MTQCVLFRLSRQSGWFLVLSGVVRTSDLECGQCQRHLTAQHNRVITPHLLTNCKPQFNAFSAKTSGMHRHHLQCDKTSAQQQRHVSVSTSLWMQSFDKCHFVSIGDTIPANTQQTTVSVFSHTLAEHITLLVI